MTDTKKRTTSELIQEETKKRLVQMQKSDYIFPASITKVDWGAIIFLIGISLILIIYCIFEDC